MALFDVSITNTPATPYFSSSSSSSPSSSSSSHFSPSNKQQKQINNRSNSPNSDHYDTPWEFKNRTLAAILGNQRLEQQQQLKNLEKQIEEKNTKNNEVNSPNSKNNNQRILNNEKEKYESEATIAIRKRLSFQGNSQKQKEELKIKNSSKQPIRQQISPKYFQNNKLANSLLEDNTKNGNQFNSNPQPNNSIKLKNDCSSKNNKESPPPLPAHKNNLQKQNSSKFPSKTPLSPIKSNLSSNNQNLIKFGDKQQQKQNLLDTQKEKTNCLSSNIQQEINKLKEIKEDKKQKQLSTNIKQRSAPSRKYPLVNLTTKNKINISNNKNEVFTFCQENSLGEEEKLINLVHEQMERAEAELLLGAMPLGSHLLRRRPDRSLALSLKANEGVLHIKLEYRCDRWVLGEGPRFNTVIEMLRAYRRVELPVRGAEQIRLTILFRPGDMPGRGLLLL